MLFFFLNCSVRNQPWCFFKIKSKPFFLGGVGVKIPPTQHEQKSDTPKDFPSLLLKKKKGDRLPGLVGDIGGWPGGVWGSPGGAGGRGKPTPTNRFQVPLAVSFREGIFLLMIYVFAFFLVKIDLRNMNFADFFWEFLVKPWVCEYSPRCCAGSVVGGGGIES